MFREWVKHIPSQIELIAIQLPGRENRFHEKPIKKTEKVVNEISNILESYFDKPFAFFGHSMGALLSYETARSLAENNKNIPEHLFISGRSSPDVVRKKSPIHHLPENLFLREIQKYGGLPKEVLDDAEMRSFFFPTLRADLEMCEKYIYNKTSALTIPITVYNGLADEGVNPSEKNGWEDMTEMPCEIKYFAGGHFFFRDSANDFFGQFRTDLENLVSKLRYKESSRVFNGKPLFGK